VSVRLTSPAASWPSGLSTYPTTSTACFLRVPAYVFCRQFASVRLAPTSAPYSHVVPAVGRANSPRQAAPKIIEDVVRNVSLEVAAALVASICA
jgi:hypothetical protein